MQRNLIHFYFGFKGRISRRDLWLLFYPVALGSFFVVAGLLKFFGISKQDMLVPVGIHVAAMTLSAVAVHAKRWHDIGCSGWFVLVGLVPGLGVIGNVAVCGFVPGTKGPNRFGEDPLEATSPPALSVPNSQRCARDLPAFSRRVRVLREMPQTARDALICGGEVG